jgi:hypothetical protein
MLASPKGLHYFYGDWVFSVLNNIFDILVIRLIESEENVSITNPHVHY